MSIYRIQLEATRQDKLTTKIRTSKRLENMAI